jgi:hypothetical protein
MSAESVFMVRFHFKRKDDVYMLFEDFFRASKGKLTANLIAKIRNVVEVFDMAGTRGADPVLVAMWLSCVCYPFLS